MIDIHHHLLYGLDDGAADLETSLEMAEMAIGDGITHVVCTPHANSEYSFSPEENAARLNCLRERVGDRLTLGLGCDFHLSYDNIEDALSHPGKYSINGKKYLLVEFPDFGIPQNISDSFYEMSIAGMVPIITHPERNLTLMQRPEKIADWLRIGCLVQVTAGSVMGRFGKGPQRIAQQLLDQRWVHVIASDAHNVTSRPPVMSEACEFIRHHYGEEESRRLCVDNPRAIFLGEALAEQPAPEKIDEEEDDEPKRRGFWSIFRRK
ncbi:MAG: CpsB/CapC family capsule biosynthesis tyrosine phosphatase [Acidobacteriaceae bacterium]